MALLYIELGGRVNIYDVGRFPKFSKSNRQILKKYDASSSHFDCLFSFFESHILMIFHYCYFSFLASAVKPSRTKRVI